jgi:DNA mismatch repair protein MutS
MVLASLLSPAGAADAGGARAEDASGTQPEDTAVLADLRLDQVIDAVVANGAEPELLTGLLVRRVRDTDTLRYRQEVFRDLEEPALLAGARRFADLMRQVRTQLDQLDRMNSVHQRQGWFLDAAASYCEAVRSLTSELTECHAGSRGLLAFRDYLTRYSASAAFRRLAEDAADRQKDLAGIRYLVRIKGPRVEVSRYQDELDYSAELEKTFERFQQGAVKDYRVSYRVWPGMNHVAAQITALVARLYPDQFSALVEFCGHHADFVDPQVRQFERELQFYLAYLAYIQRVQSAGLGFCYPELAEDSKDVFAADTFDLALAAKLVAGGKPVVTNEFRLSGAERIFVVSGPNQGGKTTFARTFGQLHHLAGLGCPVPGSAARLYLPDQIFTHFEREEDGANLTGKLEDDLRRIQRILLSATSDSIIVMNEVFTSTTVSDACFLGAKVLEKVIELDLLCVYVTFIDELASLSETVVSMASTIVPDNPAQRTYKVIRRPADGLAYALAIADKHHVTYEQLRRRIRT